jgi:serine phosphatase RsbU (regulator of sigma subunit)/streptogramin lyase
VPESPGSKNTPGSQFVVPGGWRSTPSLPLDSLIANAQPYIPASPFTLVTAIGDTLQTGVPFPVTGRKVPYNPKRRIKARPPSMKAAAVADAKELDVYHGLFSSQIISLLEDRTGRIWIGTSGGISIYNGFTFSNLTEGEGFGESGVLDFLEDSQGNIWFGTSGEGLIFFNGHEFTQYGKLEGISSPTVGDILEDAQGRIWFSTTAGVSKLENQTFTHYTINEGLSHHSVYDLHEDRFGRIWAGTEGGLSVFVGDTFRTIAATAGMSVRSILVDRQHRLWIGTMGHGLYIFESNKLSTITEVDGLCSSLVNQIYEDSNGTIWVTTVGGGVCSVQGQTIAIISRIAGMEGDFIVPVMEDQSGNLWFGAIGGGVTIYNQNSFKHFTEEEGMPSRAAYSLLEDREGNIWMGTFLGGVSKYDGKSFSNYSVAQGLPDLTVESILEDKQGNLWFGTTSGGVTKFDGSSFTTYNSDNGFTNVSVGRIIEDRQGAIWFATLGSGIFKYHNNTFTQYNEAGGLSENLVETILEDDKGNLWIGTLGAGLSILEGNQITHFTNKEGLPCHFISALYQDSRGHLWIGTMTAGAIMFDGETLTYYTKDDGLNDNLVQSIIEDKNGRIWLSTKAGMNSITFSADAPEGLVHSLDLTDGLIGIHGLQNSVLLDSRNQMWWGMNKSVALLDMNQLKLSTSPPELFMDRVDVNGELVDYRKLDTKVSGIQFDSVAAFTNCPFQLSLPHDRNHLTFFFSAIDWTAPDKIVYSYKLKGGRDGWSTPSREPWADYRNLPSGKHVFLLRARGESRQWSQPLEYSFTISPPWWFTWWAWTIYILAGIALFYLGLRWRTANLQKKQKELRHLVDERTNEISMANEELTLQNEQIFQQNKDITDSIGYAKRIQKATLPPDEVLRYLLPKHFILYKPLQIVSGDFYWLAQKENKILFAVADCTGHGVPGAFMSMLGSALLNDIVNTATELEAHTLLNELRDKVITSLRQTGRADEARDGMDISLCILDKEKLVLQFAGAHQHLYHLREGELTILKADSMPIGISSEAGKSFTSQELKLKKGDSLYLFSDGYPDQLGGERRKRLTTSRIKNIILEVQDLIMIEQQRVFEEKLEEWMGLSGKYGKVYEQIDDILVMGLRI